MIVASEGESNESYRRSSVNDEINAYVLENKDTHERCVDIVQNCRVIIGRCQISTYN